MKNSVVSMSQRSLTLVEVIRNYIYWKIIYEWYCIFKKKSFSKMFFELFVKFKKFHFLKIELKLSDMSICISIIDIFQGKFWISLTYNIAINTY